MQEKTSIEAMPNANWLQIFDAKTVSEVVMVMITSNAPKFHLHFEQKNPRNGSAKNTKELIWTGGGETLKWLNLPGKDFFPRLFASNETKVGNAASGCCVSKYDLEVSELLLSLCLIPLHRLPLTSLFITFLISLCFLLRPSLSLPLKSWWQAAGLWSNHRLAAAITVCWLVL